MINSRNWISYVKLVIHSIRIITVYVIILMVFSIARWQEQYYLHKNIAIVTTVTKWTFDCYLCVTTHLRVQFDAVYPKYMEVSIMGIRYTSDRRGNVCSGCWTRWGRNYRPLCCYTMAREASTISSSANIMPGLWIQWWWHTILRKP